MFFTYLARLLARLTFLLSLAVMLFASPPLWKRDLTAPIWALPPEVFMATFAFGLLILFVGALLGVLTDISKTLAKTKE
ncbi:hypothetical protein [Stagnihabitans tardus]|uniref:Uncharacterized protein n=1 Tax=Stagnihabitans tardus TaxID=2699202 RepID=A0AAE4YBR0_9RHOB|nr:hypothetical protein [Stagnihabitans tardus]NBZ86745.1 hypothetical protein [Stagnihabitans tardus]